MATPAKIKKEAAKKEARKAERKAEKDANIAKVEETKAAKKVAPKKAYSPPNIELPVIKKVKDIWEAVALEKKGVRVAEDGTYTVMPEKVKTPDEIQIIKSTRKRSKGKNRTCRHHGHRSQTRICVQMPNGEKVRLPATMAHKAVLEGAKYIPKKEFKSA